MEKPDLFAYLDYRKYLRDAQAAIKSRDRKASFRSFAKEAGYSSPNLLQLIISGSRDLSPAQLPGTIRALGLNKQESEFFANMVAFEHAEGFEEKNFQYQRMLRSRRFAEARPIEKGQYEYLDQWFHPAVREMILRDDFDGTPAWIADRLHPRITASQAEKSMQLLQRLGLARLDEATGKWKQTETQISTPPEIASLAVANYHRAVLKLASESIEAFSSEERDLRSVTLGIPKSRYAEIKGRLESMWKEILALSEVPGPVEEIYQINLQAFPLTREKGVKDV